MIGIKETDNGTKRRTIGQIADFQKKFDNETRQGLENVWNKIYEDAVANCPVDTMSLVGTIKLVTGDKAGQQVLNSTIIGSGMSQTVFNGTITVGDDAVINPKNGIPTSWYAIWVHDGHWDAGGKWVAGRPFLSDAFDKYEAELMAAIAKAGGP
jgi:hypothetical protein